MTVDWKQIFKLIQIASSSMEVVKYVFISTVGEKRRHKSMYLPNILVQIVGRWIPEKYGYLCYHFRSYLMDYYL